MGLVIYENQVVIRMQAGNVLGPLEPTALDSIVNKSPFTSLAKSEFSIDNSRTAVDPHNSIKLEDDIEKVELSAPSSSSASTIHGEHDIPKTNHDSDEKILLSTIPNQNSNEAVKSWLQKINSLQKKFNLESAISSSVNTSCASRVVKYQDLPYMGEMTLDNSKPRRGRKPKKADICHLIYKNYGTIFPGTPNPQNYVDATTKKNTDLLSNDLVKNDIQTKIISSLLEKRLTQECKKTLNSPELAVVNGKQAEPLNLCVRDLNHLKIRLLKNNDNTYTSSAAIKMEPASDEEHVDDQKDGKSSTPLSTPDGLVYWPTAGVFINPLVLQQQLLYYQNMSNSCNGSSPSPQSLPSVLPSDQKLLRNSPPEVKTKRPSSVTDHKTTSTKRKRSAIFIPPIPAENNANPATEVSICKFKFTGGAKPTLQEKKMLSVDSGGNFRYYSGTGDKSMRGYEFFPRETLQQQVTNSQGTTSSTGAFLQASGEKIYPELISNGKQPMVDFLLGTTQVEPASTQLAAIDDSKQKKRKSRKSIQREKLEQTFKEKGFLIQTQQLESAEGATYCKFRQLRKFTRYLFRSWKDYLPGNVRDLQEDDKLDDNLEPDDLSRNSSELSTQII